MTVVRSRDNARVKAWVRLAADPRARRKEGLALIEGPHLLDAYLQRGGAPASLIVSEPGVGREEIRLLIERSGLAPTVLSAELFAKVSTTETPAGIAAEIPIPADAVDVASSDGCVFLEGIQDAGNVGTLLRSAAAFGVQDVVYGPGCADPWSPKALRAGMGGHFFLRIAASRDLVADIGRFGRESVCTAARGGKALATLDLTGRIAWIFGSEGAGVSAAVSAAASIVATIPTPGGAESLNVAASAAICFYERGRQLSRRGAGS